MLNITQLNKQYAQIPILNNVSFNVKKGSIIGLAGPSGSGKSTLLRCIQKLEKIDNGSIVYSGTSGFVFQDFQLFPHLTVFENLTYAPTLIFKDKTCEEKAFNLLSQLGLTAKAHCFPIELSGGQKQRVALARCLMMKPNILLCDEPTSGLDVATIDNVIELLKSIHIIGVTMIIASHDVDFLAAIADRIIVLKNGAISADLTMAELSHPINTLKQIYQEQI